jgi:hypothetical protein
MTPGLVNMYTERKIDVDPIRRRLNTNGANVVMNATEPVSEFTYSM